MQIFPAKFSVEGRRTYCIRIYRIIIEGKTFVRVIYLRSMKRSKMGKSNIEEPTQPRDRKERNLHIGKGN